MNISEIIALAAQPATSAAELDVALDLIDAERAATHTALESSQARRRDLLMQDNTDKAITALDIEADRFNLKLERLDAAEHTICAQFRTFEAARAEARFGELLADYRAALGEFAPAMRDAIKKFQGLQAVRAKADSEGFHQRMRQFELPRTPFPFDMTMLDAFVAGARDSLALPRGVADAVPVYPVIFGMASNGHVTNDVAAFPAAQAWALVQSGAATWADRRNVPAPLATA